MEYAENFMSAKKCITKKANAFISKVASELSEEHSTDVEQYSITVLSEGGCYPYGADYTKLEGVKYAFNSQTEVLYKADSKEDLESAIHALMSFEIVKSQSYLNYQQNVDLGAGCADFVSGVSECTRISSVNVNGKRAVLDSYSDIRTFKNLKINHDFIFRIEELSQTDVGIDKDKISSFEVKTDYLDSGDEYPIERDYDPYDENWLLTMFELGDF